MKKFYILIWRISCYFRDLSLSKIQKINDRKKPDSDQTMKAIESFFYNLNLKIDFQNQNLKNEINDLNLNLRELFKQVQILQSAISENSKEITATRFDLEKRFENEL